MKSKIKALGHPWHLGHQYELSKLDFIEWSWLRQYKRSYSDKVRGDFMTNWVNYYEPGKYDVALLHLDQQCVDPIIYERGKGSLYRELNEVIQDIPKVVIMHGTPYYPEKFTEQFMIDKVKAIVGENTMVVNSHRAAEQWGFGTAIIHGLDPDEWWDLSKEPRVINTISPAGLDKYYDRTFLRTVKEMLEEQSISMCHITVDWTGRNWDDYRNFVGRALVYLNLTRESPMPRSRTEAMMSGCCVITTANQDAEKFMRHGENGLICKRNPQNVVDLVNFCLNNYDAAIELGQEGKKTAHELFTFDRYQEDWKKLLSDVLHREL